MLNFAFWRAEVEFVPLNASCFERSAGHRCFSARPTSTATHRTSSDVRRWAALATEMPTALNCCHIHRHTNRSVRAVSHSSREATWCPVDDFFIFYLLGIEEWFRNEHPRLRALIRNSQHRGPCRFRGTISSWRARAASHRKPCSPCRNRV